MFSAKILEIRSSFPENIKQDIQDILKSMPYQPIWQTIEWQIMLLKTGYAKQSFFIWIYEEKKLVSFTLLEKRSIGLNLYGLFAIGGPIIQDQTSSLVLSKTLKNLAQKEKTVFVQIEPLSPVSLGEFIVWHHKNFIEKYTAVIDLTQDNETILSRMKQKGRYNIRVAEKSWVTIEQVPYNEKNLDIFYSLLSETLERDRFAANSKRYFRIFLQYLEKYSLGGLFFAKRDNEVIATGLFVFFGKTALYYYGASSSDNMKRKYMASYLLQWEVVCEAKKRGCETFDFLGIAHPDDVNSPLSGVTDFKLKLTDETRQWPESQILILRNIWWNFLKIYRFIRRKR